MYLKRFPVGNFVAYKGKKFHKELFGKRGIVVARVENQDSGVVVDFGLDESFVLDENIHLAPFRGKTEEEEKAEKKEPEVQKKRNRRVVQQVAPSEGED